MVARRIEVDEFDPLTAPRVVHQVTRTPSTVNRSRLVGLSGTLILHGLAALIFIPATSTPKPRPPDPAGATMLQSVTAPADELVLVNVYKPKERNDDPAAATVDLRSQLAKSAFPLVMPDRMPVIDLSIVSADAEDSAQSDVNPGDTELRARIFGRYLDQITARVERAWVKPLIPASEQRSTDLSARTDSPSDAFKCRVQIRQDAAGNVQEVLLVECHGAEAWRQSLVTAIYQSSPLNAPPIPSVFSRALTMTFEAPVHDPMLKTD